MKNITYIHGFAGSPIDYNALIEYFPNGYNHHFIQLPFHEPCSLEVLLEKLFEENLEQWKKCDYICGYSMGGRISTLLSQILHTRLKDAFQAKLILIASGLGFLEKSDTEKRRKEDKEQAARLRRNPSSFWKSWYEKDIFCSFQSWEASKKQQWIERRLSMRPDTLAKSLENWSPAKHSYLLPILKKEKKILYIAGQRDKKYERIARMLEKEIIGSCVKIVLEASHTVMADKPEDCAKLITRWIHAKDR